MVRSDLLGCDAFGIEEGDGGFADMAALSVCPGDVDEETSLALGREVGRVDVLSDVLHCPYCHGWEVQDKAIGILGSGPNSVHQALLFRQLSDDVIYFSHTAPPDDEQTRQLAARDIRLIESEVESLEVAAMSLAELR